MVELVIASGLLALLFIALFALLDDFLSLWERSEERRSAAEESSGVLELLAADLSAPEPGQRGDLLAEWVRYDLDGDGVRESKWPRIRLVRQASEGELQRLIGRGAEEAAERAADEQLAPDLQSDAPRAQGLVEVIWTVLPVAGAPEDARAQGFLWRGERVFGPDRGADVSLFSDRYLSSTGRPRPGTTSEVTGGVLWLGMRFASQTSVLSGGWELGPELREVSAAWDAWDRGRADREHFWNEPAGGAPSPRGRPVLPRRVWLELELEHPRDLKRRTRLAEPLELEQATLRVVDGRRLPEPGRHVLVGGEWMELLGVSDEVASVRRGSRGTTPTTHAQGALVHHGGTGAGLVVREVPVSTFREDWDL
jgi:hypothetical protein